MQPTYQKRQRGQELQISTDQSDDNLEKRVPKKNKYPNPNDILRSLETKPINQYLSIISDEKKLVNLSASYKQDIFLLFLIANRMKKMPNLKKIAFPKLITHYIMKFIFDQTICSYVQKIPTMINFFIHNKTDIVEGTLYFLMQFGMTREETNVVTFNENNCPNLTFDQCLKIFDTMVLDYGFEFAVQMILEKEKPISESDKLSMKICSGFMNLWDLIENEPNINKLSIDTIDFIPRNSTKFKQVKILEISDSVIEKFPKFLEKIAIEKVFIYNCRINAYDLCENLNSNIKSLKFCEITLGEDVSFLKKFQVLEHLKLSCTGLSKFSFEKEWCPKLKKLDLNSNEILYIPDSIYELVELEKLDISNNPIEQMPFCILESKSLREFKMTFFDKNYKANEFCQLLLWNWSIKSSTIIEDEETDVEWEKKHFNPDDFLN